MVNVTDTEEVEWLYSSDCDTDALPAALRGRKNGSVLILHLFSLKEEVLKNSGRIHTDKKGIEATKSLTFSK